MTAPPVAARRPLDYPNPPLPGLPPGPNVRQAIAHQLAPHCDELLFGGARGGGKTDFALAEALRRCMAVPGLQAVFFRRTYKELSGPNGAIPRMLARGISRSVGRWYAGDKVWRFTNGSALFLSYLETLADVQAWLGLEIQLMLFDQLEQLDEATYVMVRSSLRATGPIAARLTELGLRSSSVATANPGGRGHTWVKRRFVDPYPLGDGQLFRAAPTEDEPTPMVRCFVKSLLADNPALDIGDPTYRHRLEGLPADDRKAQLEGDWNVYKGARFPTFRTGVHVRAAEEFPLPPVGAAARAVGVDYGSDAPFVALWGVLLPDDLAVVYREVAARGLSPVEQAQAILDAEEPGERTAGLPTALDPACWTAPPDKPRPPGRARGVAGPAPDGSIAWTYRRTGVAVDKADNRRLEGAADVAARLKVRPDGQPRLIILDNCRGLIETLPGLQRSTNNPEDVAKSSDDHWYDALRYLLMRLRTTPPPSTPPPAGRPVTQRPETGAASAPPTTRQPPSRGIRRRKF